MLGDIHLLRKQIYDWFSAHPNIKLSGFQFKPKKKNINTSAIYKTNSDSQFKGKVHRERP